MLSNGILDEMRAKVSIPKIPHAFFRWYCKPDKYEEIHGDLEEFFYEKVEENGLTSARLFYIWNVVRCFQPYAWKIPESQNSTMIMFKNYFKTSYRSLKRNPLNSFINLFGLSAAIGVCVVGYAFIKYTFKIDQFHQNKDEVYLTTFFADREGTEQQNGRTPTPLGAALRADLAQVANVCRVEDRKVVVKHGAFKVFHERVRYVDPEFLDMFTFPLKWGSADALHNINSVILSEEMSVKYFGKDFPVGENIKLIFDAEESKVFKVAGVAKKFQGARSFDFDFLINFENFRTSEPEYDFNDWSRFVDATFIQVKNASDLQLIEERMEKYRQAQNEIQSDWIVSSFAFQPLSTLYENSASIRGDISRDGFMDLYNSSISFVIIGFFVLVLAASNYINIAIVSAVKRLKEIGLRKVIGANRSMVIAQFLAENLMMMLIALVIGFVLGSMVFVPWLEQTMAFDMDFTLNDKVLLVFLPSILLFTGLISGLYPAFYISKFQVANIFRRSFRVGKKNYLTRIFLGFQLLLACVIISVAVMFTQNTNYQLNRSWGYENEHSLYVKVDDRSTFDQLHAKVSQDPSVVAVSGSSHHLGRSNINVVLDFPDRQYEVSQMSVDHNYFETMGLVLKDGRIFQDRKSDVETVLINETFAANLDQPIGTTFKIGETTFSVIGIIQDFHAYNFYSKIKPTIFRMADPSEYQFLTVRVNAGAETQAYEKLQTEWASLFPEIPFDGAYQEDVWGNFSEDMRNGDRFWRALALIVVSIAGLGLYGLVTLNVSGRTKEFSIRKVLGAELRNIFSNITRQYRLVFLVVMITAAPASYYLVAMIFDTFFVYYMPLDYSFFIFSGGILMLVLLTVVGTQLKRLSNANPVEGLKIE